MSDPWDSDLDAIMDEAIRANNLRGHYEGPTRKAIEHAVIGSPGTEIRTLLAQAWNYGYTTGMADAAKFEEALATAEHVITYEGPIAYPGGKDGMFRARCRCGKYESDFGTKAEVGRSGAAHLRAKRKGQAAAG